MRRRSPARCGEPLPGDDHGRTADAADTTVSDGVVLLTRICDALAAPRA